MSREREARALELRAKGHPLRKIAKELGISHMHVSRLLKRGLERLDRLSEKKAHHLRRVLLERLDRVIEKNFENADELAVVGDLDKAAAALNAVTKACAEQARLQGLYAPEKHEIVTQEGWVVRMQEGDNEAHEGARGEIGKKGGAGVHGAGSWQEVDEGGPASGGVGGPGEEPDSD